MIFVNYFNYIGLDIAFLTNKFNCVFTRLCEKNYRTVNPPDAAGENSHPNILIIIPVPFPHFWIDLDIFANFV